MPSKIPPFKYNPLAFFVFFEYIFWWQNVVDSHWFQCGFGSGSSIWGQGGSGSTFESGFRCLMTNQNCKILQLKTITFFSRIANYLSLGLQEHPAPFHFYYFVSNFCPPESGYNRPQTIDQSINQCGSWSPTLDKSVLATALHFR